MGSLRPGMKGYKGVRRRLEGDFFLRIMQRSTQPQMVAKEGQDMWPSVFAHFFSELRAHSKGKPIKNLLLPRPFEGSTKHEDSLLTAPDPPSEMSPA